MNLRNLRGVLFVIVVIASVLFALWLKPNVSSYSVGNGRTVLISTDLRTGGTGNDRGSVIEVRYRGKLESRVTTRSFIVRWLRDDSFWGGLQTARGYRSMDGSPKGGFIQGKVAEVMAAPNGFLARVTLMDTSASYPTFFEDVVLSWQARASKHWHLVANVQDRCEANPTQRMAKEGGNIYLVGDRAIYRFESNTQKFRQIAELPQNGAWYFKRFAGHRALLSYPYSQPNELPYLIYNFEGGRLAEPSRAEVAKFGVAIPTKRP